MSRELLQKSLKHIKNFSRFLGGHISEEMNQLMVDIEKELAKPEQAKYSDIVSDGGLDPRNKFDAHPEQEPEIVRRVRRYAGRRRESVSSPHITAKECIALANWIDSELAAPPRKEWVGLTDEDTANICMQGDINNWHDEQVIDATEARLKELNT